VVEREDLSFRNLFTPLPDYPYYRAAAAHPFDTAAAQEYSPNNAWWLAEASLLAYVDEPAVTPPGYDVEFFGARSTHTLVAAHDDHCIVAFRGTDDFEDVLTDLRFLVDEEDAHRGFAAALDLVWDDVRAHLGGRRTWFCGHSLGAALATLAAARYEVPAALYTYGSPRVGSGAFFERFDVPTWRFVNNNDFVAHLPPPPYVHVGRLMHFDKDGGLHDDPDLWNRLKDMALGQHERAVDTARRWISGDFSTVAGASIIDHAARFYARNTLRQIEQQ